MNFYSGTTRWHHNKPQNLFNYQQLWSRSFILLIEQLSSTVSFSDSTTEITRGFLLSDFSIPMKLSSQCLDWSISDSCWTLCWSRHNMDQYFKRWPHVSNFKVILTTLSNPHFTGWLIQLVLHDACPVPSSHSTRHLPAYPSVIPGPPHPHTELPSKWSFTARHLPRR